MLTEFKTKHGEKSGTAQTNSGRFMSPVLVYFVMVPWVIHSDTVEKLKVSILPRTPTSLRTFG